MRTTSNQPGYAVHVTIHSRTVMDVIYRYAWCVMVPGSRYIYLVGGGVNV